MKRPTKSDDGNYHISGKAYPMLIGTRAQVWHGTAYKTAGGLTKNDLVQNKAGRIVSRAKHSTAKKEMRLVKYGYGTKKGKFGYVKLNGRGKSKSRRLKGGYKGAPLTPADVGANTMIPYVVPQEFTPTDRALVGGAPYGNTIAPEVVGKLTLSDAEVASAGQGIAGAGVTDFKAQGSVGVQERAGMAGGRRRSRSRSRSRARHGGTMDRRSYGMAGGRSRSRGRGRARHGGTMDRRSYGMTMSDPLSRALVGGTTCPTITPTTM